MHWPFCPYRCHFCPFVALAGHDQYMERYHYALKKEIILFARLQQQRSVIDTLFIGGGTPSTYPPVLLLDMFDTLYNEFDFSDKSEITLEVNPGTVSQEKLAMWKKVGINRLSIGVQSLNNAVLKGLNRHQKADDVLRLLAEAESLFNSISVDLIIGLPGISEEEWKELIYQVVTWPIKHVSVYFLTVHEDTQLYFGVKQQKIVLPSDDTIVDLYHWTIKHLATHGFEQYEISNFARKGHESRHNSVYWLRKPYKGVGLGACSFDGGVRFQNEKNLMSYLEGIEDKNTVQTVSEQLSEKQIWLEELMLGLRQIKGVLVDAILEPLDEKQQMELLKTVDSLCDAQLMRRVNNRLVLNAAGLAVANEIIVRLSSI
jgi:oxygen-independent coproporphyrinogen III oxidase